MPSNEGRGYVLRKIIRRAALFAQKLGDIHIFPKLLPCLVDDQGEAFPELVKNRTLITRIITSEIERFAESLVQGQKIFQVYLEQNQQAGITQLTGEQAFKLYDTFGYPLELSRLLAQDYGLSVDFDGFEKEMKEQKERSAASRSGGGSVGDELGIPRELRTTFTGYDYTDGRGAITWVGEHEGAVWIVTDETPFYVAAGGQVDDSGFIEIDGTSYEVTGLKKVGGFTKDFSIAHRLDVPDDQREDIVLGKEVSFHVDRVARESTMNNHTATHLLQAALTTVLGSHIKQSGSVVHPDYLRFDFTHYAPLTDEQVKSIELLVNQKIRENIPVSIKRCPLKQAQDEGVIAFFGDKYDPESVRVVGIPGFSHELCGGTHVPATGAIGLFKITAESSVSNGIRRIVALTGSGAAALFDSSYQLVKGLSDHFKVPLEEVGGAVKRLEQVVSDQQRTIGELHAKIQDAQIPYWLDDIERCGKVNFLALSLSGYAVQQLRLIAEKLGKRQEGVFLVSTPQEGGKISFVIHITQAAAEHIDEKGLASALRDLGLKCGGKNSWIQGGGQANLESLKKVLQATLQQ
jgi:alanyl-tRNA synthetase